jgi:hypothetical protein
MKNIINPSKPLRFTSLLFYSYTHCIYLFTTYKMRFSTVLLCSMAGSVIAAPVAAPSLPEDLSPDAVALLASLGLGALAPSVGGIVDTLGVDV